MANMNDRQDLIKHLSLGTRVLGNERVRKAFEEIDRADFVADDYKCEAYEDYPLPIGAGQTISQPTTVALMFELLEPKGGDKILDVGSGSGWTTALLAHIVGERGKVIGVEIIPRLAEFGRKNLGKYQLTNARIENALEGTIGWPDERPYDRILVSASAEELPAGLLEQLKEGGILVMPIGGSVWKIKKLKSGFESKEYPGFAFVPLVV